MRSSVQLMACVPVVIAPALALAQVAPVREVLVPLAADSGWVRADDAASPDVPRVVFTQDILVPGIGAEGVSRLVFAEASLAGVVGAGTGAFITITSLTDGATQRLDVESLAQWSNASAYFNGPVLTLQIWSFPNVGFSRVRVDGAIVVEAGFEARTICGTTDDRIPSSDNRQGRFGGGCTAWMINDANASLLTAGHCSASSTSVMSFNIPLSSSTGSIRAASPDDQYPVDISSNQGVGGGTGNDWRYIGVFPNSNHGLTPFQRYGVRHTLAPAAPPAGSQSIRITGYGTNAAPMPRELSQTQQTHAGGYTSLSGNIVRYTADTTGGNSGSGVIDESTGLAIAIHTHGGCSSTGGSNIGTAVQNPGLQGALAAPLGICASGVGTVAGSLFAIGDQANNFGTVNPAPQNFAKVAQVGNRWQGLAFSPARGVFLAIDSQRRLFTISTTGASTLLGTVTGPTNIVTGLALDPRSPAGGERLYGVQPSSGQLFVIDPVSLVATAVGSPQGGTVRALDFDAARRVLLGIDQSGGAARLVSINTGTGARTVIGSLGESIVDCGDLAWVPEDGSLRTINAATDELLTIDPLTGAATSLGTFGGRFGSAFGLASASVHCDVDFNDDGAPSVDDIFVFINAWFAADPRTDFNNDGSRTIDDVFVFLDAWFRGC